MASMNTEIASAPLSSEVFVVELDDGEVLLGHLAFGPGTLTVFSGFAGRPRVLEQEDVVSVVPASTHPDVDSDAADQLADDEDAGPSTEQPSSTSAADETP